MPMQWKHALKAFKFELCPIASLPVATVETIGQGKWVMCCALCGSGHNLLANQPITGIYAPACSNGDHQILWKMERAAWIRQHPEAANHRTIMLKAVEAVESGESAQEAISPPALEILAKTKRRNRKQAA